MSTPFCIGLTGGIGSGKSTAALRFAELGADVIDTDQLSHQLTAPGGAAMERVREAFGDHSLTESGAMNRRWMREKIVADPAARQQLEAILHPLIRAEVRQKIAASSACYVLLVVPLLFEAGGYHDQVHRVLVMDCPEALQISRTMARSHLSEAEVRAMMALQWGREQRNQQADDLLRNDGSASLLQVQIGALHQLYLRLAAAYAAMEQALA